MHTASLLEAKTKECEELQAQLQSERDEFDLQLSALKKEMSALCKFRSHAC
jgi:hypothetical protein